MSEVDTIAMSPVPSRKNRDMEGKALHNFYDALRFVQEGGKITRVEWQDSRYFGFLEKDLLKLTKSDGSVHNWILSLGDLIAEDWVLL